MFFHKFHMLARKMTHELNECACLESFRLDICEFKIVFIITAVRPVSIVGLDKLDFSLKRMSPNFSCSMKMGGEILKKYFY